MRNNNDRYEQLKFFDPDVSQSSVVLPAGGDQGGQQIHPLIMQISQIADEIPPWGSNVVERDKALREFFPTESILSSAVYNVATRMALMPWEIVGSDPTQPKPIRTSKAVEKMLLHSDRGNGWEVFIIKLMVDLLTQDNAGFIEVIRREDSPASPVINIAHLDAGRCLRTGDPRYPVIYTDRLGRPHRLAWYQVMTIEDMPSPIESKYGLQYSAVSRALRAAQIIRDITIYKKEKISGNFARALHLVSGLTKQNLEDALALARESQLNEGLFRYKDPVVIPTIDPDANLEVKTIELASLPDHFDEETTLKWYISQLAMAFGVDYQEFAPLPGGNLGSSGQSEILHLKARGKGPAALVNRIEHLLNNNGILPSTVKFTYKEVDTRANTDMAEARYLRGRDRSLRLSSGEIDQVAAIRLAVVDGDLPEYLGDYLLSNQPVIPQEPDALTPSQVEGGQDSQGRPENAPTDSNLIQQRAVDDKKRAALIRRLNQNGDLSLPDEDLLNDILPEAIEQERRR